MTIDDEFIRDMLKIVSLADVRNANHRVIAIMFAAYVEKYLVDLICVKMPNLNPDLRKKLFEGEGCISTVAAKLDIALALGVIEKDTHADAVTIARIRNRFAHNINIDSFNDETVVKLIDKFRAVTINFQDFMVSGTPSVAKQFPKLGRKPVSNKMKFVRAAQHVVIDLVIEQKGDREYRYTYHNKTNTLRKI